MTLFENTNGLDMFFFKVYVVDLNIYLTIGIVAFLAFIYFVAEPTELNILRDLKDGQREINQRLDHVEQTQDKSFNLINQIHQKIVK